MDKNRLVIYQINPRMFTPQGNLRAAKEMLPHIKSLGVNVAYLFAICKEDDSKDRRFWSKRQKKCGLNNPKNPYRVDDYYSIDEEYGGNEQLKEFVDEAHKLGLYVMMDLVYYHCAPNAKIMSDVPDGVVRKENGEVELGEWHFPKLNFESPALREYLIENMRYFIREYGIDGYRCDHGDGVPLDFWDEAIKEVQKVNKDVIMLNEGWNAKYVLEGSFDFNYYWPALVHASEPYVDFFKSTHDYFEKEGSKEKGIYFVENHDTVTDVSRAEKRFSSRFCDLLYVYLFTVNGTPMVYCGEEIADRNEHCMFANVNHNRGYGVDWSNALLPHGKRRMKLIKKLAELRKNEDALALGSFTWINGNDKVLSYKRTYKNESITVLINFDKKAQKVEFNGEKLLSYGYKDNKLISKGFVIVKEKN